MSGAVVGPLNPGYNDGSLLPNRLRAKHKFAINKKLQVTANIAGKLFKITLGFCNINRLEEYLEMNWRLYYKMLIMCKKCTVEI